MSFLKRIQAIAKGRSKSGSKETRHEPVEPTAANEPVPEPKSMTASDNTNDMPELPPVQERLERLKALTPREREVCAHLLRGRKMKEIAGLLGVTYATVNFHCQGLYKKLCINSRAQLFVQYASLDPGDAKKAREKKA